MQNLITVSVKSFHITETGSAFVGGACTGMSDNHLLLKNCILYARSLTDPQPYVEMNGLCCTYTSVASVVFLQPGSNALSTFLFCFSVRVAVS